jgi:hypothetical protein
MPTTSPTTLPSILDGLTATPAMVTGLFYLVIYLFLWRLAANLINPRGKRSKSVLKDVFTRLPILLVAVLLLPGCRLRVAAPNLQIEVDPTVPTVDQPDTSLLNLDPTAGATQREPADHGDNLLDVRIGRAATH